MAEHAWGQLRSQVSRPAHFPSMISSSSPPRHDDRGEGSLSLWPYDSFAVSAVADGSVNLWETSLPSPANPVCSLREHSRKAHEVDWNPVRGDSFLSASWDDSLKFRALFRELSYCSLRRA
ncbi:hypothetical protein GW17_00050783 [Ensete ventricosum]|nr:hypothetical protein GW17_00050783 [Ensete ventricosum]